VFKSFPLLVLVVTVIASPAAVHAQSSTRSPGLGADEIFGIDHLGQANATMIQPVVGVSDLGASPDRPYASAYASTLRNDARPRTAIDYRFAPDGLVGSVGYLRVDNIQPLNSHELDMGESSQFSRLGSLVGANLSYAFR
jgi:hypothetical protein